MKKNTLYINEVLPHAYIARAEFQRHKARSQIDVTSSFLVLSALLKIYHTLTKSPQVSAT